jgi:hypothetical protein
MHVAVADDSGRDEVCRGAVPLADAQRMIATDWLAVFKSNGLQQAP